MDISINWRVDKNILNNIEGGLSSRTEDAVDDAAYAIIDYIRDHWSAISPSNPLETPALVTGALDESYEIDENSSGLVSSRKIDFIAEHALYLELGTVKMAPRPFLQPAIDHFETQLENRFKVVFEE